MYQILLFILAISSAKSEMDGFIVGGEEVSIQYWPFIAFIEATAPNKQIFVCGGSLLSSQTVLTAAHCLDDITQKKTLSVIYTIFMGRSTFKRASLIRYAEDYETHRSYEPDHEDIRGDIGVIFLNSPVKFIRNVKKVILVRQKFNSMKDKHLLVAGWGRYDTGKKVRISANLKHVKLRSIPLKECAARHPYIKDITKVVCAAPSHEFAYSGDSGGPMVQQSKRLQLGIVSFRNEETRVTVFTSVPAYYNWIKQTNLNLYKKHCEDS